jgi:predicted membrane protein
MEKQQQQKKKKRKKKKQKIDEEEEEARPAIYMRNPNTKLKSSFFGTENSYITQTDASASPMGTITTCTTSIIASS